MKFIIIAALVSFYSSAQICQSQFLRAFQQEKAEEFFRVTKGALEEMHEKTKAAATIREKLDIMEEQFFLIQKLYNERVGFETKLLQTDGHSPAQVAAMIEDKNKEVMAELAMYPDRIVEEAKDIFSQQGIPVSVKTRNTDGVQHKYLELGSGTNTNSMAVKKIERYKDRFGTKEVTFDIYQNIINGSAGFSIAAVKRIDLGIRGLRNLALDDIITMVGKHEFHHAAFAAKRTRNVGSIYHASYIANGEKNLSSAATGYNKFMSAEEVYNWANNSFWASSRFSNVSNYLPEDYLFDVKVINSYLEGTYHIASQTREVAGRTVAALKRSYDEIDNKTFQFLILDEKKTMANSVEEAFQFAIVDEKNEMFVLEFLGPEYKKDLAEILKNREKINVKYTQQLQAAKSPEEQTKLMLAMFAEENENSSKHLKSLLKTFEEKQKLLGKVAKGLEFKTMESIEKTKLFRQKISAALKEDKDLLKNDPNAFVKEFKEIFHEYRTLGNVVKEDYKGFAGN